MPSAYLQKLRDPRWQKTRLKILERDNFKCVSCGDNGSTLHVHHCHYEKGFDPWDYLPVSLVTLCEYCHEDETAFFYQSRNEMTQKMATMGATSLGFNSLRDSLERIAHWGKGNEILLFLSEIVNRLYDDEELFNEVTKGHKDD